MSCVCCKRDFGWVCLETTRGHAHQQGFSICPFNACFTFIFTVLALLSINTKFRYLFEKFKKTEDDILYVVLIGVISIFIVVVLYSSVFVIAENFRIQRRSITYLAPLLWIFLSLGLLSIGFFTEEIMRYVLIIDSIVIGITLLLLFLYLLWSGCGKSNHFIQQDNAYYNQEDEEENIQNDRGFNRPVQVHSNKKLGSIQDTRNKNIRNFKRKTNLRHTFIRDPENLENIIEKELKIVSFTKDIDIPIGQTYFREFEEEKEY